MPWAPALLLRVQIEKETKPYLYTAIWGFVFLSVSRNKLPAYVLPLLPSLAMLIAGRLLRWHYAVAAGILVALPMAAPWLPIAIEEGLATRNLVGNFAAAQFHFERARLLVGPKENGKVLGLCGEILFEPCIDLFDDPFGFFRFIGELQDSGLDTVGAGSA